MEEIRGLYVVMKHLSDITITVEKEAEPEALFVCI